MADLASELVPARAAALEASRDDPRATMPEPPAVSLVSVRDVRLPMVAGLESRMDAFYAGLLRFERVGPQPGDEGPVYRAENHDVRFAIVEVPGEREGCRPIGIVTPFFGEIVERLSADKIELEIIRGLVAGADGLLVQDPAGNWLALAPLRKFS